VSHVARVPRNTSNPSGRQHPETFPIRRVRLRPVERREIERARIIIRGDQGGRELEHVGRAERMRLAIFEEGDTR
jgi:hypothetical protein